MDPVVPPRKAADNIMPLCVLIGSAARYNAVHHVATRNTVQHVAA
jgi:hypothetical protein